MQPSIIHNPALVNALERISLLNTFTACVRKNILRVIESCFFAGYRGNTMDFSRYSDRHRTSLAHFLNKGKWNSATLRTNLRQSVVETVYPHSRKINQPVLCIIDDTIASKTRPSSQAAHPIEAASNHILHLKGHMDYGHQAIGVMLACGELVLNYAIILYDKSQSKCKIVLVSRIDSFYTFHRNIIPYFYLKSQKNLSFSKLFPSHLQAYVPWAGQCLTPP